MIPDIRSVGVGRLLYALGFAVVGAIGLAAHDFVLNQQPVPKDIPWREGLACLSGGLLLLTGVGLLVPRVARVSALVLTAFLFLWILLLQVPRVAAHPLVELYWLGVGEDLSLATGGWILYCAIAGAEDSTRRVVLSLFGISLLPIGLSHLVYLQGAAQLIPTWFPMRVPLTAFTGVAHIAAGLAILFGLVPWLAATLEAVMESAFTLIVWVSAVIANPTTVENWVNLFISATITGAAWAVAESYRRSPVRVPAPLSRRAA